MQKGPHFFTVFGGCRVVGKLYRIIRPLPFARIVKLVAVGADGSSWKSLRHFREAKVTSYEPGRYKVVGQTNSSDHSDDEMCNLIQRVNRAI